MIKCTLSAPLRLPLSGHDVFKWCLVIIAPPWIKALLQSCDDLRGGYMLSSNQTPDNEHPTQSTMKPQPMSYTSLSLSFLLNTFSYTCITFWYKLFSVTRFLKSEQYTAVGAHQQEVKWLYWTSTWVNKLFSQFATGGSKSIGSVQLWTGIAVHYLR